MAHFAAFDAHWWMFKREGPAFIGMTLQTSFFIPERLVDEFGARCHPPSWRESTVRIMTVAARHEAFVDAMLEGH